MKTLSILAVSLPFFLTSIMTGQSVEARKNKVSRKHSNRVKKDKSASGKERPLATIREGHQLGRVNIKETTVQLRLPISTLVKRAKTANKSRVTGIGARVAIEKGVPLIRVDASTSGKSKNLRVKGQSIFLRKKGLVLTKLKSGEMVLVVKTLKPGSFESQLPVDTIPLNHLVKEDGKFVRGRQSIRVLGEKNEHLADVSFSL